MRKEQPLPSQACLKLRFDYNPETGELTHRMNAPGPCGAKYKAGDIATTVHKRTGYRRVFIEKTEWRANRVIWMWMTGIDPGHLLVDHIDRDRLNDRWENLRLAARKRDDRSEGIVCNQSNRENLPEEKVRFLSGPHRQKRWFSYTLLPDGRRISKGFMTREEALSHQWD